MNKDSHFTGLPVYSQVLKLLDKEKIFPLFWRYYGIRSHLIEDYTMPNRIISVQRTPGKRLFDITKPLLAVVISLVAMTALFFISLLAVSHIKKSSISQNALISAQTIDEEGLKRKIGGIPIFRLDNFTDALMINIATNIDERNTMESAMNCTYTYRGNRMSVTQGIRDAINEDYEHDAFEYARYWHGYLLFLRPLLTATDYSGIRILNYVVLSLLLGGIMWLGIRRKMYGTIVYLSAFWVDKSFSLASRKSKGIHNVSKGVVSKSVKAVMLPIMQNRADSQVLFFGCLSVHNIYIVAANTV